MQKNIKSSVLRCKSVDPRHRRDVVIFAETETQKQQQQQQQKTQNTAVTLQKSGLTFQGFLKSVSIEVSVMQKEKRRKKMVAVHVGRVNHSHCTKIQFFLALECV